MRKRKLKMQTAKLIAIMYILYVVLADMAAVGGGLIRPKAADANIGNYEAYVSTSEGPGIRINTQTNGKVTTFNFNTVEGSRLQYSSYKIGVFSVKLDNKEYFYSAGSTYSETTPGLYYDNGSWKFVAPSEVEPSKLQVQLASRVEKFGTNSIDIYYPGYKGDISVCKDLLDTKLNGVVQLQCYGYDAKAVTVKYTGTASTNTIGFDNLNFVKSSQSGNDYVYEICFGGTRGESPVYLTVHDQAQDTLTAGRIPGTNQVKMSANYVDITNSYVYISCYKNPDGSGAELARHPTSPVVDMKVSDDNKNKLIGGYPIKYYDNEGIYLPWETSTNAFNDNQYVLMFGTEGNEKAYVSKKDTYKLYAPASSALGEIQAGNSKNITDNLIDIKKVKTDYFGTITGIKNMTKGEDGSFSDDYFTIDSQGNVTAKKAGAKKTYTVTAETKYTKIKTDNGKYVYDTDNADGSPDYGTQTCTFTVTVTPVAGSSTEDTSKPTTTQEPTTAKVPTTTQAPTTQAPTITGIAVKTKPSAIGSYNAGTTKGNINLTGGKLTVTYSDKTTKDIDMTSSDVTVAGIVQKSSVTNADKTKDTITKTVTLNYGGKSCTFDFSYDEEHVLSEDEKAHTVKLAVTPTAMADNVTLSKSSAKKGEAVTVTVNDTIEACDATITSSNAVLTKGSNGAYTFTMPAANVTINVAYKQLSDISVTAPTKKNYDGYTEADKLDLTGGKITATYGASTKKEIAMTSPDVTVTINEAGITHKQGSGVITFTVPVNVKYGSKVKSNAFSYTYDVPIEKYDISLEIPSGQEGQPEVSIDKKKAANGDTVTITLPEDSQNRYAFPEVTVKTASGTAVTTAMTVKDKEYTFTMPAEAVRVIVSYAEINELKVTTPPTGPTGCTDMQELSNLPENGIATATYVNAQSQKKNTREVKIENSSYQMKGIEYGTETEGKITNTVTIAYDVSYGGKSANGEFKYTYTYETSSGGSSEAVVHKINKTVTPEGMEGNVFISRESAIAGATIKVILEDTPVQAVTKITDEKGNEITITKDAGNSNISTFEMPDSDITISVAYESIKSVGFKTEPAKKKYDSYVTATQLDLTGGELEVTYSNGSNTRKKEVSLLDKYVSVTVGDKPSSPTETENGVETYKVTVTVTYGEGSTQKSTTYNYTYDEKVDYTITKEVSPIAEASNVVGLDEKANSGDVISFVALYDTTKKVKVTVSDGSKAIDVKNTGVQYSFTMPAANVTVKVEYLSVTAINLALPASLEATSRLMPDQLADKAGDVEIVYGTGANSVTEKASIYDLYLSGYIDIDEGTVKTEDIGNGKVKYSYTVTVTLDKEYAGTQKTGTFEYYYTADKLTEKQEYDVAIAASSNDFPAKVSTETAFVGDTITITPDALRAVDSVSINGEKISAKNNVYETVLTEKMLKDGVFSVKVEYKAITRLGDVTIALPDNKTVTSVSDLSFGNNKIKAYYGNGASNYTEIPLTHSSVKKASNFKKEKTETQGGYTVTTYSVEITIDGKTGKVYFTTRAKAAAVNDPSKTDVSGDDIEDGEDGDESEDDAQSVKKPKRVTISSCKNQKKKKLVVKWKKISKVSGYEVSIALNKKFKKGKKVKNVKGTSYTFKSLKKKKKYYVRVRAYTLSKGKKIYGAYSKIKTVKIKK